MGLPGGSDCYESACNAGDPGLIPGSGRSPAEGKGYQQRNLAGYSPWGRKESDMTEQLTLSLSVLTEIRSPMWNISIGYPFSWHRISTS